MQLGTIVCCFEGEVDPDWRWFEGPMADTGVRFEIVGSATQNRFERWLYNPFRSRWLKIPNLLAATRLS